MIELCKPQTLPLGGDVTLHVIPTRLFKSARLSLVTVMPADRDLSPRMTLLFRLLTRGTEQYPRRMLLNRRLDELYGTTLTIRNTHNGDDHILALTAELLEDEFLPAADRDTDLLGGTLAILAQLVLHPLRDADGLLRPDVLEDEKKALCDDIQDSRSQPRSYAADRLRTLLYPGEPSGVSLYGEPEQIMAVTPADLTAVWRDWITHARFEVFYIGRASTDRLREAWHAAFGDWSPAARPLTPTRLHPAPPVPRRIDEERLLSQGKLCMSLTCDIDEGREPELYAAAVLFNELLGTMQGSLLFRHVREELGLCYNCDSAYYGAKGVLAISCGIRPGRRTAAEQAVNDCIQRAKNGDITEQDVELARASYRNACRQIPDSPCAMENVWLSHVLSAGSGCTEHPTDRMRAVLSATREQVIAAAARFVPDTVYFLGSEAADDAPDAGEASLPAEGEEL